MARDDTRHAISDLLRRVVNREFSDEELQRLNALALTVGVHFIVNKSPMDMPNSVLMIVLWHSRHQSVDWCHSSSAIIEHDRGEKWKMTAGGAPWPRPRRFGTPPTGTMKECIDYFNDRCKRFLNDDNMQNVRHKKEHTE